MAGQNVVSLKGNIIAGPPRSSCNAFPSGLFNAAFELRPPNKSAPVSTHNTPSISSAAAFVELSGVGTAQSVTQATFLYLQTNAKMLVQLTQEGDSGDEVSVLYVDGLLILEFPSANYLKLIEAKGVGVIEYFASGNV